MIKNIYDNLFIAKQKSILLTEKNKLENEIKRLDKFPSYGNSEDDNAQEVEDFGGNLGIDKQLRKLLTEINLALEKIKNGKYGYCDNCHQLIDKARLRAFPAATTCLNCLNK